jgi:hypothetical protein
MNSRSFVKLTNRRTNGDFDFFDMAREALLRYSPIYESVRIVALNPKLVRGTRLSPDFARRKQSSIYSGGRFYMPAEKVVDFGGQYQCHNPKF